jgi:predicted component of type VI protein secretion system
MAKALYGHVGVGNDVRLVAEVMRLRSRVRDLESELDRALAVNEVLASQVDVSDELRALDQEPALT